MFILLKMLFKYVTIITKSAGGAVKKDFAALFRGCREEVHSNMIKIMIVCANGIGSSLTCQMAVEAVLKELGVQQKRDSRKATACLRGERLDLSNQ